MARKADTDQKLTPTGTLKGGKTSSQDLAALKQELAEKEQLVSLYTSAGMATDRASMIEALLPALKTLFDAEDIFICRFDQHTDTLKPFARVSASKRKNHSKFQELLTASLPARDGFIDKALSSEVPLVQDLYAVAHQQPAPPYINTLLEAGLSESISAALRLGSDIVGMFTLWKEEKGSFSAKHKRLINQIADFLAVHLSNLRDTEIIRKREDEKEMLLALSRELSFIRDKQELLPLLQKQLKQLSFYNDISIAKVDDGGTTFSSFLLDSRSERRADENSQQMEQAHHTFPDGVFEWALKATEPVFFDVSELVRNAVVPAYIHFIHKHGIVHLAGVSLRDRKKEIGVLFLFSKNKKWFTTDQLRLVQAIGDQLGTAVANIIANEKIEKQLEEIKRYREQLEEENQYLQQEVSGVYAQDDMIGNGKEMSRIFHQVLQVAPANSTVLIMGETGTGKELIARAIHKASTRSSHLLVKVNCAALPANLIESELFGHEKGSFTGAIEKRIGKFELANNGTLFLDEIGELPADLQAKLLRAIQEKEIERIGGRTSIRVNVRIIAATNRDLQSEVDAGKFRKDLFYRLNVFPIVLPALRDRKEDIPALVNHFIARYAKNAGKNIKGVTARVMKQLIAYAWPGNVRELEHQVERSVLLATGPTIREVFLPSGQHVHGHTNGEEPLKTHEENEREHIIRVLQKCNGKIFGPGGAASILGMRVSTLNSKIKKLGIKKNKIYN